MGINSKREFRLQTQEETYYSQFPAATTDLSILSGEIGAPDELKNGTLHCGTTYSMTPSKRTPGNVLVGGLMMTDDQPYSYSAASIRPVIQSMSLFAKLLLKSHKVHDRIEVEYGEYPQYAPAREVQKELESEYHAGRLKTTGKTFTLSIGEDKSSVPLAHEEYEYEGKKYIRYKANSSKDRLERFVLHNREKYANGDYVWVEVSPIIWLVDLSNKILVTKRGLLSGIPFSDEPYYGDFEKTRMYRFLNDYFAKDIVPSKGVTLDQPSKKEESEPNSYGLTFDKVSEEDIIRGAIESGVALFLHGPSSEGKSARVKAIDPDCVIIYLRNATPESLNGKSVLNQEQGVMIDHKPSWLVKLEERCAAEPDRLHILFFDEITNALPGIQGSAFNIVLDREVNGIWKLPPNARVVAAGNDMQDSIAANQLAEPLFNRFAHVYIKTTTESWLKWASEHGIHPAIYSYIAFKKGSTLRSKYDGEKPNADPRKWEMASKMLYATGNPEMLRALVGEDITREFVQFCKQKVITLEDVISGSCTDDQIKELNTAERYATTMGLTRVDETHLTEVRNFVKKIGAEFVAIFDALWTRGEEERLERIAEEKLAVMSEGGMKI